MYPIILSLGPVSISSFGLFLSLAILFGSFVIWRLTNVYDLDPEKILDIIFLTFIGGLIGSRIYFIASNYSNFHSITKMILINRYPGFTFFGGLIMGGLILYILSRKFKLDFWLIADFALVGLFLGLAIGSIGCLLSGCQYGNVSNSFLAVSEVGLIGKRFPVQVLYSLSYLFGFSILWGICLRFHFKGKVAIFGLLLLALIIFTLGFFRGDTQKIYAKFSLDHIVAAILFTIGLITYYILSRRSLKKDLNYIKHLLIDSRVRTSSLSKLSKSCYNLWVNFQLFFSRWYKKITKKLNVKSNPTQF